MRCYLQLDEKDKAIALAQQTVEDFPGELSSYIAAIGLHMQLEDKDAARLLLDNAYGTLSETSPKTDILRLAEYALDLGDFIRGAQALVPITDVTAYSQLSRALIRCYFEAARPADALEICRQITEHNSPVRYITEMHSYILQSIGDLPNAIEVCLAHLRVYPDDTMISFCLCLLYARTQRSDLLVQLLDKMNVSEIRLPVAHSFQLAFLLLSVRAVEKSLQLAYRVRLEHITDWKAHSCYHSLLSKMLQSGETSLAKARVEIDTRVTLRFADSSMAIYTIATGGEDNAITPDNYIARQLLGRELGGVGTLMAVDEAREYEIIGLTSKYVFAHTQSTHLLATDFRDQSEVVTFDIAGQENGDADLSGFFGFIDKIEDADAELAAYYKGGLLTIAGYALRRGLNEVAGWFRVTGDPRFGVYSEHVSDPGFDASSAKLDDRIDIIIDSYSLLACAQLGILEQLQKLPNRKVAAHVALEGVMDYISELRLMGAGQVCSLKKDNGRYYRVDTRPEDIMSMVAHLEKILQWLKDNCTVLPVNEALKINFHEKNQMDQIIGRASIDAILLAKEHDALLFTEELAVRSVAGNDHGVASMSTNGMLRYLYEKKHINNKQRVDKVVGLLGMNYRLLTVDADVLLGSLAVSGYTVNPVFMTALLSLGRYCTVDSSQTAVLQFLYLLYHRHPAIDKQNIMVRLLDTLIDGRSPYLMLGSLYRRVAATPGFSKEMKRDICGLIRKYRDKIVTGV